MRPARLAVGRIAKPHGVRGEVSVEVWSDAPHRFDPGSVLGGEVGDEVRTFTVAAARRHHGRLLVTFDEIADRTDAEGARGIVLTIPAEEAEPLPEWTFYPHDLAGCAVLDTQGTRLGTLRRVDEGPANDLWVVATSRGSVAVPAVRAIVRSVDLEARTIVVDPPEGLF